MKNLLSAEDMRERAWPEAFTLIRHEQDRTGSRMNAYRAVARSIGWSKAKLQKLIGRQPFALHAHELLNLSQAYERLCARIEAQAAIERLRATQARERTSASLASNPRMVDHEAGADRGRARGTARMA